MTDGRCGTCQHFRIPGDLRGVTPGGDEWYGHTSPGELDDPATVDRWGYCGLIRLPEYGEKVTIPAYTQDASDFIAVLHVRDDFGCVLWVKDDHP